MSKEIKVTDKRMFTPDGELREEFRELESTGDRESPPPREPGDEVANTQGDADGPGLDSGPASPPPPADDAAPPPPLELPSTPPELGGPSFFDLVGLLAEPASLYLGDARLPDGSTAENLEMARLHIDLLDVLRQKTAGRLTSQESAVLEDVLYRLRMRYVQKRG